MKVNKNIKEPDFKPFTLEITFEKECELQFFRQLIGNMSAAESEKIAQQIIPYSDMLSDIYRPLLSN